VTQVAKGFYFLYEKAIVIIHILFGYQGGKTTMQYIFTNQGNKGQKYLADCGLNAAWLFKCPPYKNMGVCLDNEYGGAWVPYVITYSAEYGQCQYVKEYAKGRQFSQDFNVNYK
jgi:hypothetical protein